VRWERIEAALPGQNARLPDGLMMPPLMPMQAWVLPTDPAPITAAQLSMMINEAALLTVCLAMTAAWALMQQPKLAERSRLPAPRDEARRAHRAGLTDPAVTLLDLRKLYRPQVSDHFDQDAPARTYRHRWVVTGHWPGPVPTPPEVDPRPRKGT